MPALHTPTNDVVAAAWIKGVQGVPEGKVATTLPGDSSSWSDGFIVVETVGGDMNAVGVRRPVINCRCYVTRGSGTKAPRGQANVLADYLVAATLGPDGHGNVGRVVDPGRDFKSARVDDVTTVSVPRWVEGEPAGVARFDVELAFRWVPLG